MENNDSNSTGKTTGLIVGIVIVLACICLITLGISGYAFYIFSQSASAGDLPVFVGQQMDVFIDAGARKQSEVTNKTEAGPAESRR